MPALYSHFYRVVQDLQGNVVPSVMGTVTLAGTGTLATLYGDAEGSTTLPTPLTTDPEYGSFSLYLDAGQYDMSFAKVDYVFEPLKDILIAEATGGVSSLVGTPNQVIVSSAFGDIVLSTPQNLDPDASVQFAHLGLGTPAGAVHGLTVETTSDFRATINARNIVSIGDVTARRFMVSDYAGDNAWAYYTTLNAAGGTNRWAIWAGGTAPSLLGGTLQVNGAVTLLSTLNIASNLAVGGSLSVTGTVSSPNWGGFTGGVTAGAASQPGGGRKLDVYGDAYFSAHTGLGALPLPGQFHVNAGSMQAASLSSLAGVYAAAAVNCDTLNVRSSGSFIAAYCGIGRAAAGGWGLAVSNFYADGQVQADNFYARAGMDCGSLNVRGTSYFGSLIGVYYAADGGYWLRIPSIFADSVRMSGGSVDGNLTAGGTVTTAALTVTGNATVNNQFVVGNNMGIGMQPVAGIHLSLSGVGANKLGGGPFGDSSNRALKRNITTIEGALALLLAQQGRTYEWTEPIHATSLPGLRYGFIAEEVTVPQWKTELPDGSTIVAAEGFEALTVEALRELTQRLEALESALGG